jgi:hypothetical protein
MLAEVGSRLKPEWSHSCRNTSLYAHEEEIFHSLTANQMAAARFLRIQQSLDGFITESALNP